MSLYTFFLNETQVEEPMISFNLSMLNILKEFIASGKNSILILEDDVVFKPPILTVGRSLKDLEGRPWSLAYLGANLYDFPFEFVTPRLARVRGAWCTHAVGYSREGAIQIVTAFEPVMKKNIYDDYLARVYLPCAEALPGYIVYPMAAEQAKGTSDLMNSEIDYSVCWTNTRARLSKAFKKYL